METAVLTWLGNFGAAAFRWSAVAFILVNGIAIASFVVTRDRGLVNRWTGRLLTANLVLLGTGVGVPVITSASRLIVAIAFQGSAVAMPAIDRDAATPRSTASPFQR